MTIQEEKRFGKTDDVKWGVGSRIYDWRRTTWERKKTRTEVRVSETRMIDSESCELDFMRSMVGETRSMGIGEVLTWLIHYWDFDSDSVQSDALWFDNGRKIVRSDFVGRIQEEWGRNGRPIFWRHRLIITSNSPMAGNRSKLLWQREWPGRRGRYGYDWREGRREYIGDDRQVKKGRVKLALATVLWLAKPILFGNLEPWLKQRSAWKKNFQGNGCARCQRWLIFQGIWVSPE